GALACGLDGALAAGPDGGAVAAAVAEALHAVADEGDLAFKAALGRGLECVQGGELDHLGLERALGADAATQGGDHQRLRKGRDDFRALVLAQPDGEGHRLQPDPVEAHLLEAGLGPGHGTGIGLAAGQARADLGGQAFDEVPGEVAGQGLLAQALGGGDGLGVQAGIGGPHGRRGEGGESKETSKQTAVNAHPFLSWNEGAGPEAGAVGERSGQRDLSASRISVSSFTSSLGPGGGASAASCLRLSEFIALMNRKMAKAMMRKSTMVWMKAP